MRSNLAMSEKTVPLATGLDVRRAARSGALDAPTSGLAPGYVQGNLAILPHDYAEDFLRFCQANPKPCPLLGVSEAGDPAGTRRLCRAVRARYTAPAGERRPTPRKLTNGALHRASRRTARYTAPCAST